MRLTLNGPHERKPTKATNSKIWIPKFGCVDTKSDFGKIYNSKFCDLIFWSFWQNLHPKSVKVWTLVMRSLNHGSRQPDVVQPLLKCLRDQGRGLQCTDDASVGMSNLPSMTVATHA